jgi:hypothetical protein
MDPTSNKASPGREQSPALLRLVDATVFEQVEKAENHDYSDDCINGRHEVLLPNFRYTGLCLSEPASYKVTPR